MKIQPLQLSEEDMRTKALPDQSPGDVSDAQSNVVPDDQLQSPEDWTRVQGQIESGELESAIQAEEAQLNPVQEQQQQHQENPQAQPQDHQQQQQQEPKRIDDLGPDDDNGSAPIEIGMFGDLQANPTTGAAPIGNQTPVLPQALQDLSATPAQEEPVQQQQQQPAEEPRSPQYRIRGADDVENLALELRKKADIANQPLSLEKALTLAKETLNVSTEESQEADEAASSEFQTVEQIEAEIEKLEDEMDNAAVTMDVDQIPVKRQEIRRLRKEIPKVQEVNDQRKTAYTEGYQASYAKAVNLYPAAQDQNSDFFKAMAEMDAALQESGDRRYHTAEKPMLLARAVAERLGVLPNVSVGKAPRVQQGSAAAGTTPRAKYQAASPVPVSANTGGVGHQAPAREVEIENEDQYLSLKESFSI